MYLDGDMELAPEWLDQAVPFILEHPEAAGVDGYSRNIYMRGGQIVDEQDVHCNPQGSTVEVTFFCGAAIYWRSPLEKVGGFNPYLISLEEPELCMRLRYVGYKLLRLPYLMCTHYGLPENSWEYCVRRVRTNLWAGYGQVPRYHLKSGLLGTFLREYGAYTVFYLIGMLTSIASALLVLFLQNVWPLVIWVLVVGAVFIAFWVKKRSLRGALLSLFLQTALAYSAVRGFLMPPRSPADYPTDAEIVQVHCRRGSLS